MFEEGAGIAERQTYLLFNVNGSGMFSCKYSA